MTFKSKALAGLNPKLLLLTDSMGAPIPSRFACKIAAIQATAAFPNSTIVQKVRNPGAADTVTTVQSGTNGQTLTIIIDSESGATSYRADYRSAILDAEAVDSVIFMFGINDAANFEDYPATYNATNYYTNMRAFVLYAQQTGYEAIVMTPAWADPYGSLLLKYAGIAWIVRRLCVAHGCKCIDLRRMCEDHYANTGSGGLGTYPDNWSDGDDVHLNEAFHTAAAAKAWQTIMA